MCNPSDIRECVKPYEKAAAAAAEKAGNPASLALPRDLLRACVPHCSAEQRETIRARIQSCQ